MFYVNILGVIKPLACATTMSIAINADLKEATKQTSSRWREYYPGMLGYSVTVDGLFVLDQAVTSVYDLMYNITTGTVLSWIAKDVLNENVRMFGNVLQNALTITSPADNDHTFNVGFTGTGPIVMDGTWEPGNHILLENEGKIVLEDNSGTIIKE